MSLIKFTTPCLQGAEVPEGAAAAGGGGQGRGEGGRGGPGGEGWRGAGMIGDSEDWEEVLFVRVCMWLCACMRCVCVCVCV